MNHEDRKRLLWLPWESAEADESMAQRSISPGKRTLTMSLPPPLASTTAPVQQVSLRREARPAAVLQRKEQAALTDRWMDAAVRPDLHGTPVQRRGGDAQSPDEVHQLAAGGITGTATALPHLDRIQRSFGHHDVSGVRAYVAGPAAEASRAMGAQAYATGNHIAFREPPDVHTAAHEAAHVVQQRRGVRLQGGVGMPGDAHERQADAVADRVVQGRNADDLLDTTSGPSQAAGLQQMQSGNDHGPRVGPAVQRQTRHLPPRVSAPHPTWRDSEIRQIQRQLRRLGLYRGGIDGEHGPDTDAALVEAFGGDAWRTLPAPDVLARLRAASPPAGRAGEHNLRYGEMFADGLLDMTLGVGFDEGNWHTRSALPQIRQALAARGFQVNNALGAQLYREAGRSVPRNPFGVFYVRLNALTYSPPAGPARQIHAVVRLVTSPDGSQGAQAAEAFREGLTESDVAYYGGHGRYGSGPDFDRNMRFELLDDEGNLEPNGLVTNYRELERRLRAEGAQARPRRSAWSQFLWRNRHNRIAVDGDNEGNIMLNSQNPHGGEFGANLMFWNLRRRRGGADIATGRGGDLAQRATAHPDRRYRVVVFNGCRTVDYERSIRATPGFDTRSTDMFGSSHTLDWRDIGASLAEFLDGILQMQSAEEITREMDAVQRHSGSGRVHAYGEEDNPVFPSSGRR